MRGLQVPGAERVQSTHPGSKLRKDGKAVPHGEEFSLAPRSLVELLNSTAVFPCLQVEQELLDLLYHSEGGRVDKIMRQREMSPHGERSFIMTCGSLCFSW